MSHHILAFADTESQVCSSGPEIQKLLGYLDGYLVPTTHQIHGITNNRLHERMFYSYACQLVQGRHNKLYVADNTPSLYLSQTVLKNLDMLPLDFSTLASNNLTINANKRAPYGCPRRTSVPSKPDTIPFPPTESNKHQLEKLIKEHFKSSACPHQSF